MENHEIAYTVAGVFALLAAVLSFAQMRLHVLWNTKDALRKHVLRILLMVPIYAFESWMGLRYSSSAMYFNVLRECYEAMVIYSFLQYLVESLGGEDRVVQILAERPEQPHIAPFCCCATWEPGAHFYYNSVIGALQFVVVKPVMALLTFVLANTGDFHDGDFSPTNGYPYVAFITNLSQTVALYSLVLFYLALKDDLAPFKPVPKFLVVKSVVFFTFWQGVFLAICVHYGWIHRTKDFSASSVESGVQDFLVCVEMFFAAVALHYAFYYKDYHDGSDAPAPRMFRTVLDAVDVRDVYVDHVRTVVKKKRHHSKRRRAEGGTGQALISGGADSADGGGGAAAGAGPAAADADDGDGDAGVGLGAGPVRTLGAATYGAVRASHESPGYTPPSPSAVADRSPSFPPLPAPGAAGGDDRAEH